MQDPTHRRLARALLIAISSTALAYSARDARAQNPQDYLTPPEELGRFEPLLGNWQTEGTYRVGDMEVPWTARNTMRKILNGHAIEDDLVVEMRDGDQVYEYVSKTWYGWSRDQGSYWLLSIDNFGKVTRADVAWPEDGTLVSASTVVDRDTGQISIERSVNSYEGDTTQFQMVRLRGSAAPETVLEGKGRKGGEDVVVQPEQLAKGPGEAPEEMLAVKGMAGKYAVEGKVVPFPGVPPVEIAANETVHSLANGALLLMHIEGTKPAGPQTYEAWGILAWHPQTRSHVSYFIDNMGGTGTTYGRRVDKKLVMIGANPTYGMLDAQRTTLSFREDGTIQRVESLHFGPLGNPYVGFEANYKKTAGEAEEKSEPTEATEESAEEK